MATKRILVQPDASPFQIPDTLGSPGPEEGWSGQLPPPRLSPCLSRWRRQRSGGSCRTQQQQFILNRQGNWRQPHGFALGTVIWYPVDAMHLLQVVHTTPLLSYNSQATTVVYLKGGLQIPAFAVILLPSAVHLEERLTVSQSVS